MSRLRPLAAAIVLSCATGAFAAAPQAVAPVLNGTDAVDDQSFARPQDARVTHVDLDLAADFDRHILEGSAALDILARPGAKEIRLDALHLDILSVTDATGRPLRWAMGVGDEERGAPLIVQLGDAKRILIRYRSRADARALQWLPPNLTAGKREPFMFSQGQDTNNRSWIPTQDSPGIRQTWTARIVVPEGLVALMSGERLTPQGEAAGPGKRAFRFRMEHPVPPYLIALAAGDLRFHALGARTGVWAEPATLKSAAAELADTEKMVRAAEALYGSYRWGRYDVLVLPPAFPFGGMENTTLTFATPTFITGDRANVDLIAHELAHSWSGNLVTNATWKDLWLNEGFTTYVENRIIEALYGPARAEVDADLDWETLARRVASAGTTPNKTRLYDGADGRIPYLKGAALLRTIESQVGRQRFDAYLRSYFGRHAFSPQTTAGFLADLRTNLIKGDVALETRLMLDQWVYGVGLPGNAVHPVSARLQDVDRQRKAFVDGTPARDLTVSDWTTKEWQRFLGGFSAPLAAGRLDDLDQTFRLSQSTNAYVRTEWLQIAIANRYEPAMASLQLFLGSVGRGLFLVPLYQGLMEQGDWGRALARKFFAESRATYHPTVASELEKLVTAS